VLLWPTHLFARAEMADLKSPMSRTPCPVLLDALQSESSADVKGVFGCPAGREDENSSMSATREGSATSTDAIAFM
jgi:hypothetical protein